MRLALVVVEEDARAAVQLADDDALGAVDDEGAGVRHQRDFAEVDLLLLDVADDALATVAGVVDHQLRRHLDRRRERHAALAALVDVVLGLLQVVGHEHELARAVEVLDREDAAEDGLKARLLAIVLRDRRLQELVVRRLLDVDEVRDLDDTLDPSQVLSDAEVGLDSGRHRCSSFRVASLAARAGPDTGTLTKPISEKGLIRRLRPRRIRARGLGRLV